MVIQKTKGITVDEVNREKPPLPSEESSCQPPIFRTEPVFVERTQGRAERANSSSAQQRVL